MKPKLPPLLVGRNHALIAVPTTEGDVTLMLLKLTITSDPRDESHDQELEIALQIEDALALGRELTQKALEAQQTVEARKKKH